MSIATEVFDAKVSVRSKMHYLVNIKAKLASHPNRDIMFRNSVFGRWLDIPHSPNDNHLLNYVLQHQVFVPHVSISSPDLVYKIGNQELHFGRREFCLITGFRCGNLPPEDSKQSCFTYRVFPDKKSKKTKSVKASELWADVQNEQRWVALNDEDAVRVCLFVVCELIFMGREEFLNVHHHLLTLADDFFAWNVYPWGEYMWTYFYKRTVNVVPKHANMHLELKKQESKKQATYNLNAFVSVLKVSSM